MNELEYLIRQLNLIVGFLDVSDRKVYNQIRDHDRFQLGISIDSLYEGRFENYRNHITTSSLILGFTHFEDFIRKIVSKILLVNPGKNKIKVTISKFQRLGTDYLKKLGDEQARKLRFSEKINLLKNTYRDLDEDLIKEIVFVNKIRNCLMHNNGYADERLSPQFSNGEKISLTPDQIHEYGLKVRDFADTLWGKINENNNGI